MKKSWFKDLDEQSIIDLKQAYKESLLVRKSLSKLLEEKKRLSHAKSFSSTSYDNPNWAYLQADARGYERALNEIIELIS